MPCSMYFKVGETEAKVEMNATAIEKASRDDLLRKVVAAEQQRLRSVSDAAKAKLKREGGTD